MAAQFDFRTVLLRIQDLLSDTDRQRLHFLFGDDVPRHLRDDQSVGGAIRVLESLFDKAIINDQDCDYLIEAFRNIHCHNAAQRLQEYQRAQQQGDNKNYSLEGILLEGNEEDKAPTSVVVLQESGSRFYVSPSIKSTNFIFNDKSTQIVPSDRSETRKHISLSWCINELFKKRLAIREILLIAVVILFALAFLMAMVFSKNQRKSTPCTEASVNQSVKGSDGICASARWIQSAVTVAGGKGRGLRIDQFSGPNGLFFDENGTLYVADTFNHRITKWAHAASTGSVVAGGKGNGSSSEQLNLPVDVVVDENGTLYVVDTLNRRVQQWFAHASSGQPIIGNLSVSGIARDDQGSLYTCDWTENQVRKWQKDDTVGQILVFGLAYAKRLYVDSNHSVYVSDTNNHRVIKIDQGTSEPSVVAGGSFGTELHQLNYPESVKVDRLGNVYVADTRNHRIMRWQVGATSGTLIAGGRGNGSRSDQLNNPTDIQFDRDGNLYAADAANHRVQKFLLDKSSC